MWESIFVFYSYMPQRASRLQSLGRVTGSSSSSFISAPCFKASIYCQSYSRKNLNDLNCQNRTKADHRGSCKDPGHFLTFPITTLYPENVLSLEILAILDQNDHSFWFPYRFSLPVFWPLSEASASNAWDMRRTPERKLSFRCEN